MNPNTFIISKLEDFDISLYDYINDYLNIFCNTENGWTKVPVIFSTPERSWSSKSDDVERDLGHLSLKYPIISVARKNIEKPLSKDASFQGNVFSSNPFMMAVPIYFSINSEKTADRANADSKRYAGTLNARKIKTKRTIYNVYKIPVPTFTVISYELSIVCNFQSQMNDILGVFLKSSRNSNWFKVVRNGHGYEGFYDESFTSNSNLENMNDEERKVEYSFSLKLKGYLHEGEENDKGPSVIRVENQPEIVFKAEIAEKI